jgi:glycosyltransferase involved in cell wall biosynthesis
MKILWMSSSPTAPTGFGNVTRYVCAGLADYGHQVSILGWQTRGPERWHKCTLYPIRRNFESDGLGGFDVNILLEYLSRLRPDVFVMQTDVSWLPYFHHPIIANFVRTAGIAWALYYPIDGDRGENRLPEDWINLLKTIDIPIAMSRYGAQVSQANGVGAACIPLGVDSRVFHPPQSKERAKQALGYDGRFVILSDARNQPHKQLPRTLEIFRRFAADKDDVLLHLHCDPEDPLTRSPVYCYDLRSEIAELDLTSKVRITAGMSMSGGLSLAELAKLYQAADVHLLASLGEGFGLPTLQAAATGVVPMAPDYSANSELVREHGEAIRVHHFWADQFGVRRAFIDMDDATSHLEQLYQDRSRLAAKAQAAYCFAKGYDWQHVVSRWHDLLQREIPHRQGHRLVKGRW